MFLKWGDRPEYTNWPSAPRYITCTLSDLLENVEDYLKEKTHARVTLDVPITYEEANFMRETFIDTYKVREFKLIYSSENEHEQDTDMDISFQTVDQIVTEQLSAIDSENFDPLTLVNIYNGL